ncbi:MAG: ADP-ribosylglycohydrolase family protein [Chloroflexota bacterium]
MARATEDRFLGALLGLAIGDALGMPLAGLSRDEIAARYGPIRGYHPLVDPERGDVEAGEVTEETETVLAIAETMTTSGGVLDPELAGPRLAHLVATESRRWFTPLAVEGILRAEAGFDCQLPLDEDAPLPADVLVRGVPIGLVHAVGALDREDLLADAEAAVRLSHGSTAAISGVAMVAAMTRNAATGETAPGEWAASAAGLLGGEVAEQVASTVGRYESAALPGALDRALAAGGETGPLSAAVLAAIRADRFEDAVFAMTEAGGPADTAGALAGALAGARFGSSGIPQPLIDDLGCRIYVSLAAPWLLKAARRRAGSVIDLLPRFDGPRPDMPPRV